MTVRLSSSDRSARGLLRTLVGSVFVCLVLGTVVLVAAPQALGAEASYVILSDSMEPTFGAGDLVVVRSVPPDAVATGDVITFERADSDGTLTVSHRVVAVEERGGEIRYRTKGDANPSVDRRPVPTENLVGRVWFAVPLVGHLVIFARTPVGIVTLVVVPGVLLVVNELWTLYRDATSGGGR